MESKKTMNLIQDRTRLSDKLTVTKGERRGQGINWESGLTGMTDKIHDEILLSSVGNATQYLVITYNEKELEYI